MKILIKMVQGQPKELEVSEYDPLKRVEEFVESAFNVPVSRQKLVYYGLVLDESTIPLAEYGIVEGDTLTVLNVEAHIISR